MMRSKWLRITGYILMMVGFLMTGFWTGSFISRSLPAQAAKTSNSLIQPEDTPAKVTLSSSARDVVLLMLRSSERWLTLSFKSKVQFKNKDNSLQEKWVVGDIEKGSITGPFVYSITTTKQDGGEPVYLSFSDGKTKWEVQNEVKYYKKEPLGLGLLPPDELPVINDSNHPIIPHPISGKLGTPIADMIFPQGISQQIALDLSTEKVRIIGEEKIAERIAVMLQYDMGSDTEYKSRFIFWVDGTTGVILKEQFYDATGLKNEQWNHQYEFTEIHIDGVNKKLSISLNLDGYSELNFREYRRIVNQALEEKGLAK